MAFDASGNLFIADVNNSRIRKVDTNGNITTAAGNGSLSYSGDGGAATNASLLYPSDVALDAFGSLYVSDGGHARIRKVDTNGNITTVAGNGSLSYSGDVGAATNASFHPDGIAFDASGNLYIADTSFSVIRKVCFAGNPIFTLGKIVANNAGNYTVVITSPYGSITSAVATLTVTIPSTPPQIITSGAGFGLATNQFGFGFKLSGAFGQTIVVDGSTNLANWTPLFTNTAGSTPAYFIDPTATNYPGRYYRARLQQ